MLNVILGILSLRCKELMCRSGLRSPTLINADLPHAQLSVRCTEAEIEAGALWQAKMMIMSGLSGPHCRKFVGPCRAIWRILSAATRCMAPLLEEIKRVASEASAAKSSIVEISYSAAGLSAAAAARSIAARSPFVPLRITIAFRFPAIRPMSSP
jgi:hypothetical protein